MTPLALRALALSTLAYGLTPALQLPLLLLTTHLLPSAQFGIFALVQAVVLVLIEVSGLGASDLLIARVAVDRTGLSRHWSRAVWTTVASWLLIAPAFGLLVWFASSALFADPAGWLVAALLYGGSELLFGRLIVTIDHLGVAIERQALGSLARAAAPALRLLALFAVVPFGPADLATVFVIYGAGSAAAAIALLAWVNRRVTRLEAFSLALVTTAGWPFAANQLLRAVQGNADRLLLGVALPAAAVGQYAVAARVASTALLPTAVMLRSTYPRFFQHGAGGVGALAGYVRTVVLSAFVTSALSASAIAAFALLAPHLLGTSYAMVGPLAWWLVPLPFLSTASYLLGDMLTGLQLQPLRTALVLPAFALQLALILALADAVGAFAAIIAQYAFLAVLAGSFLVALQFVQRRAEAR